MSQVKGIAAFVLMICASSILFLLPIEVTPVFSGAQSLADIQNPSLFGAILSLMVLLTILASLYFSERHPVLALSAILIYSFIFLNFWIIKSPVPLGSESPLQLELVKQVVVTGRDNGFTYLQYPSIYLVGSFLSILTSLPVSASGAIIGLARAPILAILIFLLASRFLNNRKGVAICTILAVQGDLWLSHIPEFHPEVFGLIFFFLGMLVLTKKQPTSIDKLTFVILFLGSAIAYSLASLFLSSMVLFFFVLRRRFGLTYGFDGYWVVFLSLAISISWNFLVASQLTGALSTLLTNPPNLAYLFLVASSNVAHAPSWVSQSSAILLALLFAIPALAVSFQILVRRKFSLIHSIIIVLLLNAFVILVIQGAGTVLRVPPYLAPFSSAVLIGGVTAFRRWPIVLGAIAGIIIILSFPVFIGYNLQANGNATYPQAVSAGTYVEAYYSLPGNQPLFMSTTTDMTGFSALIFQTHNLKTGGLSPATPGEYYAELNKTITIFHSNRGALYATSDYLLLSSEFTYGQVDTVHYYQNFVNSISMTSDLVYANNFTTIYYSH